MFMLAIVNQPACAFFEDQAASRNCAAICASLSCGAKISINRHAYTRRKAALSQTHPRRARFEQMMRIQRHELAVAFRVIRHRHDDADTHAKLDIRLDDVGTDGGQYDIGNRARASERLIDMQTSREILIVDDDRILRDLLQRKSFTPTSG